MLSFIHKILLFKEPLYLYEFFIPLKSVNARNTRSHQLFLLPPKSKCKMYYFSLSVNGAKLWNSLPDHVFNIKSKNVFTKEVTKIIKK
jgi:hypothetical protein